MRELPTLEKGDAAMQEYRVSWELFQQGRYEQAIAGLKALIAHETGFWRAYRTLVDAYERRQELDEAERHFQAIATADSSVGMAEWALAYVAWIRQRFPDAVRHAVRCVSVSPGAWPCYEMLGRSTSYSRHPSQDAESRDSDLRRAGVAPLNRLVFLTAAHVEGGHRSEARTEAVAGLEQARTVGDADLALYFLQALASGTGLSHSGSRQQMDALAGALRAAARLGDDGAYFLLASQWVVSLLDAGDADTGYRLRNALLPQLRARTLWILLADVVTSPAQFEADHGNVEEAVRLFSEAIEYYRRVGELKGAISRIFRIADIRLNNGQYEEAIHWYEEARRANQDPHFAIYEGFALRGIGNAYGRMGEYLKALDLQQRSIPEFEKARRPDCVGASLGNIGALYLEMGSAQEAISYFQRALASAMRFDDGDGQEENLVNLGDARLRLGQPAKAIEYLRRALKLADATTYSMATSAALRGLGLAESRLGHMPAAMEWYTRALDLAAKSKLPVEEAQALELLGRSDVRMGRVAEARTRFEEAVKTGDAIGSAEVALAARRGLASLALRAGNWHEARDTLQTAIQHLEQMRATVPTPELRTSYLRDRAGVYEDMLYTLERLDRAEPAADWAREAFGYAERARARAFLEMLAESRTLSAQTAAPLDAANAQTQAVDTTTLEYALGDRISLLWVVTSRQIRMLRLPPRPVIEKQIRAFRDLIASPLGPGTDLNRWRAAAGNLWTSLLGPAGADVSRSAKWVIVPDGVLHYLPFEALVSPAGRCVVEDHTVVYAASSSALAALRQSRYFTPSGKELLAYGDPDLGSGDGTLPAVVRSVYRSAGFGLGPLPNTRREIQSIASVFPPSQSVVRLGAAATESSLKQSDLTQYRRLHFATHAVMDERSPARSGVVLTLNDPGGEDGILRMSEIAKLKLNADVVVLSACRTGLGALVRGEGLVGLTRAFQYAGASRVVVSLWEVDDAATADLMQAFYSAMGRGRSPGEALRAAKAGMLTAGAPTYRHPYYWAPFVLAGPE